MIRYLQNSIAKSGATPWVVALYTLIIWLLAGGVQHQWWLQLVCLMMTAYLFIELNNSDALIRVRSRMVTSTFLVLYASFPMLFGSLVSHLIYFSLTTFFLITFSTYQNPQARGRMYLAFLLISVCSMADIRLLFLVPFLWLLCATQLQSLSWHTWGTSILGLITPYWLVTPLLFWSDFQQKAVEHFSQIRAFSKPFHLGILGDSQKLTLTLILLLSAISIIHLWQKAYEDRIRTRQIYGFFTWILLLATLWLTVQPILYELLLPVIIVCASPLIAHFFALTNSKPTNILFIVSSVLFLLLTANSLYPTVLPLLFSELTNLWNGLLNF